MGGHDNGQLASRMTINTIAQHMTRELLLAPLASEEKEGVPASPPDEDSLVNLLHDAIEEANTVLCDVNARNKTDMGSTLTGFMIVGQHAYIVNVGDSRTYMIRGGQLYQLTTDHSLVAQLVASGLIEPDDVYTHPQRSQIYRSLGDKPNTPIDIFKQQLHPGDKLLACCDGLWEMVHNPQIEGVLNTAPDPQTACQQLIDLANDNGGEDNITAVLVYVQ
jgi:serine/threonine protein phosphatase PrpC